MWRRSLLEILLQCPEPLSTMLLFVGWLFHVSPTSPCREDHHNQEAHDALAANQSAPPPSPASLGSSMGIESIHDPMEDLEHEEQNELSLSQELSAIIEQELNEDQT